MSYIDEMDVPAIVSEIADNYWCYRNEYGAPRTKAGGLEMIDDILSPLLTKLSAFERYEKSAQAKLENISKLLNENVGEV